MHSYAFICKKYANICKICRHEIYMQNTHSPLCWWRHQAAQPGPVSEEVLDVLSHVLYCTSHWVTGMSALALVASNEPTNAFYVPFGLPGTPILAYSLWHTQAVKVLCFWNLNYRLAALMDAVKILSPLLSNLSMAVPCCTPRQWRYYALDELASPCSATSQQATQAESRQAKKRCAFLGLTANLCKT